MSLITADPALPPFTVDFQVPDGYLLIGDIPYSALISFTDHNQNFSQSQKGTFPQAGPYVIDLGGVIIGGAFSCDLGLPVQDLATGAQSTYDLNVQFDITGINPDKATIKAALPDLPTQVIAFVESTFRQFAADGTPLWGPPTGFGVMQIDPPANVAEVFNWRTNIADALDLLATKKNEIAGYVNRTQQQYPNATDFTPDQLQLMIYQYYNGGYYYKWGDPSTSWVKNPDIPNMQGQDFTYGENAVNIQNAVSSGNPPDGWS